VASFQRMAYHVHSELPRCADHAQLHDHASLVCRPTDEWSELSSAVCRVYGGHPIPNPERGARHAFKF
jgi:hypothetical protein